MNVRAPKMLEVGTEIPTQETSCSFEELHFQ